MGHLEHYFLLWNDLRLNNKAGGLFMKLIFKYWSRARLGPAHSHCITTGIARI